MFSSKVSQFYFITLFLPSFIVLSEKKRNGINGVFSF